MASQGADYSPSCYTPGQDNWEREAQGGGGGGGKERRESEARGDNVVLGGGLEPRINTLLVRILREGGRWVVGVEDIPVDQRG